MIRYIKDILDIKNILGAQPTPLPLRPANETVIHALANTTITPYFTGTLTIKRVVNGTESTITRNSSQSGIGWNFPSDRNTDVIITGNLQKIEIAQHHGGTDYQAIADTVEELVINGAAGVIDLRNANAIQAASISGALTKGTKVLYANATTADAKSACISIINGSNVAYSTLWIDRTQPYAQDVIAVAKAHGWRVYYL